MINYQYSDSSEIKLGHVVGFKYVSSSSVLSYGIIIYKAKRASYLGILSIYPQRQKPYIISSGFQENLTETLSRVKYPILDINKQGVANLLMVYEFGCIPKYLPEGYFLGDNFKQPQPYVERYFEFVEKHNNIPFHFP